MWFIRHMGSEYDVAVDMNITYTGIPDYLELTPILPSQLQVVLHDNSRNAFYYRHHHFDITIDLSTQCIGDNGEVNITNGMLRQQIVKLLKEDTKLLHITPEVIGATYQQIVTEKVFAVELTPTNVPRHTQLHLFPSEVMVTVQVGMNHFQSVSANDITAICVFPHEDVTQLPVVISTKNKYILSTRVSPQTVDFLIEETSR